MRGGVLVQITYNLLGKCKAQDVECVIPNTGNNLAIGNHKAIAPPHNKTLYVRVRSCG